MPNAPKVYRPQGKSRPAAHKRGYDHDWNRLSQWHKTQHPLCEDCKAEGKTTGVEIVDHVVPIRVDPARRLDPSNLRSLCRRHHAIKTNRDQT